MSEENVEYVDISVEIIKKFKRPLKFDVYIKRSETTYSKIFKEGDIVDPDRLDSYESKGVEYFYVTSDDYKIYALFVERIGDVLASDVKKFSPEQSTEFLKELTHFTMREIMNESTLNQRTLHNASNVVDATLNSLQRNPKELLKIMELMAHQPYMYKHSVSTSIFATVLAQAFGIENEANLKNIALGAFLHDIGESKLSFNPEDTENLTDEQRKELELHPQLGAKMLERLKSIRQDVIDIVAQHHERQDGKGYPAKLKGGDIYQPAKIVGIADAFVSLIMNRPHRPKMTVKEALAELQKNEGQFEKRLLRTFVRVFEKEKAA